MSKTESSVEELVGQIERGELRLPEMQRKYVWRGPRVRDLLDSLYRGYPSGAILVWETGSDVALQDFAVGQASNPYATTKLLLDGQQRLTSLSAVVRGRPVSVRGRKKPIDILFNLEHPDELPFITEVNETSDDDSDEDADDLTDAVEDELSLRFSRMAFVVASKRLAQLPQWVSVTEVFNTDSDAKFLEKAGVESFSDPRFAKYSERLKNLRAIKKYMYTVHILGRDMSYEEVTEIFVRVNSLGAKLKSSDLATAQITSKWRNSLKEFESFAQECEKLGFPIDTGLVVRNLVALITGQSRFKTVTSIPEATLRETWPESQEALRFALNFVRANADIDSIALLSSPAILVALAYYGHTNEHRASEQESAALLRWFHLANSKGRYTRGSAETVLDQDLGTIAKRGGVDGLLRLLRAQVGRLPIEPADLEGRNQRSGLFKAMFLAFRAAGARDWDSNLKISVKHSGATHRLQFHHIFPRALVKDRFDSKVVNDVANLAFIGGRTNRRISADRPEIYLNKLLDSGREALLKAQCIPLEPQLFVLDRYPDFLAKRRVLIAERLNAFIDVPQADAAPSAVPN